MVAEVGKVSNDSRLHSVRPTVNGPEALCGAGTIAARVPGRFDPDARGACPECAAATAER